MLVKPQQLFAKICAFIGYNKNFFERCFELKLKGFKNGEAF